VETMMPANVDNFLDKYLGIVSSLKAFLLLIGNLEQRGIVQITSALIAMY
jgi:hypothetical protein